MASETSSSEISSSQATQISNSTSSANPSQLPSLITVIPIVNPQLSIKLDDDNFLLWKNQMLNSIIAHGFDDFIDRFRPCPPRFLANQPGEVNPDYTVWQRHDFPSIEEVHNLLLNYEYRLEQQNSNVQLDPILANVAALNQPNFSKLPYPHTIKLPSIHLIIASLANHQTKTIPSNRDPETVIKLETNQNVKCVTNLAILQTFVTTGLI
ncbi:uncharacterized protein LOC21412525 isoform X1 [Morus notabilis]|uniref:uncharacterized protein LOC21412525 isoform X1 n=1 Tax=Morus notabilis TaxID=981085 RepID=UPI000CED536D|nr:uncharacterized protein LOC21412525 isoform X1 [Morus notabilis]